MTSPMEAPPLFWEPWSWVDDGWVSLAAHVVQDQLPGDHPLFPADAKGDPTWRYNALASAWDDFRALEIPYQEPAWSSSISQVIRDPDIVRIEGGTCIDLVLYFAGISLRTGLRPLVLVDPAYAPSTGHAVVAVAMGDRVASLDALPWQAGVAVVDRLALARLVDDREITVLDCTDATRAVDPNKPRRQLTFESAAREGASFLTPLNGTGWVANWRLGDIAVIDLVAAQKVRGQLLLPINRAARPTISFQLPQVAEWTDFPTRNRLVGELLAHVYDQRRWIVIHGPAGVGKSRLAHRVASRARTGTWFLNGSDRSTLRRELAAAIAFEAAQNVDEADAPARQEAATDALDRLHASTAPWTVVLDNANCAPADLVGARPRPTDPGQIVIVTTLSTHLDDWLAFAPDALAVEVSPLTGEDLASVDMDLGPAADRTAGTALLVRAYDALRRYVGAERFDVAVADVEPTGDGPADWWATTRRLLDDSLCDAAHSAAWLPPEAIPEDLLGGEAAAVLARHGVLTLSIARLRSSHLYDLHRTFGAAIRASDRNAPARAIALVCKGAVASHLDAFGDLSSLNRFADAVGGAHDREDGIDGVGLAMVELGDLYELHGRIVRTENGTPWRSAEQFHRAAADRADVRAVPLRRADCLHGMARAVNQDDHRNGRQLTDEADRTRQLAIVETALSWLEEARTLRAGHAKLEARTDALTGLLLQKQARFLAGPAKVELLERALEVVRTSRDVRVDIIRRERLRTGLPPDDDREIGRAKFNIGGAANDLAAALPPDAQSRKRRYLDESERAYTEVAALRRRIYNDRPSQHIASCDWGSGLVEYQRARMLVLDAQERVDRLRTASRRVRAALDAQERIDDGDGVDVRKSLQLETKIADRRLDLATGRNGRFVSSLRREVDNEGTAIPADSGSHPILRCDPDAPVSDLIAAIDAWSTHPALRSLVDRFGGTVLAREADLAGRLDELADFSTRWDFRRGAERNVASAADDVEAHGDAIRLAALDLGLVTSPAPRFGRYDHVVVLGGLARACLLRPQLASEVLSKGVTTRTLTAVAAFRPLAGNEPQLLASLDMPVLDTEFDVMDHGMRRAFALDAVIDERGERRPDAPNESWCVRRYAAPGLDHVAVVAAPTTDPTRRANTPDSYEYLARELLDFRGGERVLLVTSAIYVPYQHTDAIRMLGLPHRLRVDTVAVEADAVDEPLRQIFTASAYLQEVRSSILATRNLLAAIGKNAA